MTQADFVYGASGPAHGGHSLSIFADRPYLRQQLREDAEEAGFTVRHAGALADLLDSRPRALGEAVMLDCPAADEPALAALASLDEEAQRTGAQLIISTRLEALDGVYSCCERSDPQILVEPSAADRVIALGRVLAAGGRGRVREMTKEDRLTLLRLTEQVGQLAAKLDAFGGAAGGSGGLAGAPGAGEGPATALAGDPDLASERLVRASRPSLPDPRLVRQIIRHRQLRTRFIDGNLFADPAWDILLDLTAARAEHVRVSVSSLCIAAGVPPTTGLRWISQMTEAGLLQRVEDEGDRRRAFIALTDKVAEAMARYFAEVGRGAGQLV